MKQRFFALDVFRGMTVAFMILVNTPGSWSYIYPPLDHAKWHGYTPTDLVFPFFLFAVGNALAFVLQKTAATSASIFWQKTFRRALLIFLIGLLLNWFPFVKYNTAGMLEAKSFSDLRIQGVLQRIAICYFFAAIIAYYLKPAGSFLAAIALLLGYWAFCLALGNTGDPYSLPGWFGTGIDRALLGENHMYHGEGIAFDPEGFSSTLPAIAQVLFGYLVGDYIIRKMGTASLDPKSNSTLYMLVTNLLVLALLLVFTGLCWDIVFPINKKIWTSSYVVFTTGMALIVLSLCIYTLDIRHWKRGWASFFNSFGKNPLFIFVLSGVWARLYGLFRIEDGVWDGKPIYKGLGAYMYDHFFAPVFGQMNGSFLYAIVHVLVFWLIARWLDKKKIYIKV